MCAITAGIKRYKSAIKKNKKKHDKTVLFQKSKLNSKKVLISKVSIHSVISHNEFALIDNVLKEYNEMKVEIKTLDLISSLDLAHIAKASQCKVFKQYTKVH